MIRQDSHAQYAELAVGYALYALEPEEEQTFVAHLSACAACERAVAEHAETLAHLAYAVEPADPPPALLEGIRASVRAAEGEASSPTEGELSGSAGPTALPPPARLDLARRARAGRQRRELPRAAAWVGAAAAFALVASLGVWNTVLHRDRAQSEQRADTVQQAVDSLRGGGARTVPLTADGGQVVAVAIVRDRSLSLVVDGLARNDAATTSYVLWAKDRVGSVQAVTAFDVANDDLDVLQDVALSASGDDLTRFMVTHEDGNTPPPVSMRPVLAAGDA